MTIPNNLVDAAAAVGNGELGTVETVKIGDLIVSALTGVDYPTSLSVTRKPIQTGFTITDAAVDNADDLVLDIVLTNPDYSAESGITAAITGDVSAFNETWRDKRDTLYDYLKEREILQVQTHDHLFDNMLIQSITPAYDVDSNLEAWIGTVVLVPIRLIEDDSQQGKKASAETPQGGR
jgi:hypothetical protein